MNEGKISFRWGIPELDHGNVMIPEPIYRFHGKLGVTGNQFVLIVQLSAFKYESKNSITCPSIATLANRMGLNPRSVMRLVSELEEDGWLTVKRTHGKNNVYDFQNLSKACWQLYIEATSDKMYTSSIADTPDKTYTSTSDKTSPQLVTKCTPEEKEYKNKNTKKKTSVGNDYSEDFETAWQTWIKLKRTPDKKKAFDKWRATLRRNGTSPERLIEAAQNYATYCEKAGTEPKYVKHAATFFGSSEPWQDFLDGNMTERLAELKSKSKNNIGLIVNGREPGYYDDLLRGGE